MAKKRVVASIFFILLACLSIAYASVYEHYPSNFVTVYNVPHIESEDDSIKIKVTFRTIDPDLKYKYDVVEQLRPYAEDISSDLQCKTTVLSSGISKWNRNNAEGWHRECSPKSDPVPYLKQHVYPEWREELYRNLEVAYWIDE